MIISNTSWWGIRCVWLRYYSVFMKSLPYYVVTTFLEPIFYLLSFGLGVGGLVGQVDFFGETIPYRKFIFSGIIAQTILFQGFFEAAYGGFIRMYYQKIFHAMAITPITLSEVLWGELIWDASKATLAAEVVALIGVATGDFPASCLITLLPLLFFGSLLFAGLGLAVAAFSKSIEEISYPQYLLVFPMFLFCGVFYPIQKLPSILQGIAWALPLTSAISMIRTLTLGSKLELQAIPIFTLWLLVIVYTSRRAMTQRLVK